MYFVLPSAGWNWHFSNPTSLPACTPAGTCAAGVAPELQLTSNTAARIQMAIKKWLVFIDRMPLFPRAGSFRYSSIRNTLLTSNLLEAKLALADLHVRPRPASMEGKRALNPDKLDYPDIVRDRESIDGFISSDSRYNFGLRSNIPPAKPRYYRAIGRSAPWQEGYNGC
jgi:hypothetical protein